MRAMKEAGMAGNSRRRRQEGTCFSIEALPTTRTRSVRQERPPHLLRRRPAPSSAAVRKDSTGRPDGRRARADAFETVPGHPQRRVFAHAQFMRHQRSTFGPYPSITLEWDARMGPTGAWGS